VSCAGFGRQRVKLLPALTRDPLIPQPRLMTLDEFRSHWERRRDEYARLHAQIDAATLIDHLLADLELATANHHETLLTLTQAARACGYSADHLGRLVRTGQLTNHGRRHAPRVRSGDLPRRIQRQPAVPGGAPTTYDPVADAWALRSRQRTGHGDGIG